MLYLDDISLPQIVISSNYDVPSRKISSCRSMQFLDESMSLGANFSLFAESLFQCVIYRAKEFFFLTDTTLTDSFRLYAINL